MKRTIVLLITISMLLSISACGGTIGTSEISTASGENTDAKTPEKSTVEKDTLIVAQQVDVVSMDPHMVGSMTDMNVLINIYDGLTAIDKDGNLIPALATEWKAIDELTWEFKLREGVKFHNGEPFNADAVKFTVERLIDKTNPVRVVEFANVVECKKIDDYTVQIISSAPDPILPNKGVLFTGLMLPPKYVQENGLDYLAKNPVGCGPYKFVSWTKDSEVVLEAYSDYWRGEPEFKKLIIRTIPNAADMVAALRAGEIDIAASGLNADIAKQLSNNTDIEIVNEPWIRIFFINLNCRIEPLNKKEVRQAINYAIDFDSIIENLYGGYAQRAETIVAKQAFGYDKSIKPYSYDPEKAKQLLVDAGYPDGISIDFMCTNTDSAIAQAIAAYLNEVDIKTTIELVDSTTLNAKRAESASPMYYVGNTAWTGDAVINLQTYVKSDRKYARIDNERLDELIDIVETTIEPQTRLDAFSEIQEIISEEAYFLFCWQLDTLMAVRKDVEYSPNVIGYLWMHTAKRR